MSTAKGAPRTDRKLPANLLPPTELLPFGDNGEAFERHMNLGRLQSFIALNAVAMLEIGRRLIWHKANLAHGEFLKDLTTLPFTRKTAARYMNAARKLQGSNVRALLHLGVEKVCQLVEELDEDELKLLVDGTAVDAVTLDAVAKMTCRELRDALRKEREPKKKLVDAEERVKELEAENQALKRGVVMAPTVQNARKLAGMASDRIDEACSYVRRIAIPEDGDPRERDKVIAIVHQVLAGAESQLQTIMADMVDANVPG